MKKGLEPAERRRQARRAHERRIRAAARKQLDRERLSQLAKLERLQRDEAA